MRFKSSANLLKAFAIGTSSLLVCGCASNSESLQAFAGTISSVTGGVVSQSQISSFFKAGEGLDKGLQSLSPEQEYYLGRSVSAAILSRYKPLGNETLQRYVNRVGLLLASNSERPETFAGYHFVVLDSKEVNALSAPGGFVFVTSGLLRLTKDEDMLASVLAHEIGHVVNGDGVDAISQSNLTSALLIIGKEVADSTVDSNITSITNLFEDSVTDVVNTLIDQGYSRSQEYAADRFAVELMKKTGYSTIAMRDSLENLERLEAVSKDEGGWLSTHPDAEDRISEISSLLPETQAADMLKPRQIRAGRFKREARAVAG